MPLLFETVHQGEVAFGFFNIESDMLLLNTHFFYADDFARVIGTIAAGNQLLLGGEITPVYTIAEERIGNVMGAIRGYDLRGFIGDVYKRFPFPSDLQGFRQNPDGHKTRNTIEGIVSGYAGPSALAVLVDGEMGTVAFGEYVFDKKGFQELVRYVWVGGYPRWKDASPPRYVHNMKDAIAVSTGSLFEGMRF